MKDFSIVIPTIVNLSIYKLLNSINKSSLKPKEVIISIPKGKNFIFDQEKFCFDTKVISRTFGQVLQRIEGFKEVKTPLCIQMDDDIQFDKDFLRSLVTNFEELEGNSVLAPLTKINGEPFSMLVSPKPPFASLMYYVLDSKFSPKFGSITKSGMPLGVNPFFDKNSESPIVETCWINGGCMIHRTSNLINDWEYPYEGKAYAEDLFHSSLLKSRNLNLYIDRSLFYKLDDEIGEKYINFPLYIKSRIPLFRAINAIPNIEVNAIRFYTFSILYVFVKAIRKIFNFF